uniref:Uncharacterized protein n=1 Tax=Anopheles darlingi TaxID=43151 RepID=A0A2M4DMJ0_ANODA
MRSGFYPGRLSHRPRLPLLFCCFFSAGVPLATALLYSACVAGGETFGRFYTPDATPGDDDSNLLLLPFLRSSNRILTADR